MVSDEKRELDICLRRFELLRLADFILDRIGEVNVNIFMGKNYRIDEERCFMSWISSFRRQQISRLMMRISFTVQLLARV